MPFQAKAKGEILELNFYGHVGDRWSEDGISYKRVSKALRDNPQATHLKIRAHSFGGDAMEGHAIRNLLQASQKYITMEIDGVAASAMSVISTVADEVRIAEDAQFMIHNSRGFAMGTADQIKSDIQALENLDDAMVSVYAARTKQTHKQIREWMEAETWFTAKQAKEHGFVDAIVPAKGIKAQADARFGFRALPEKYAHVLQQLPSATTVAETMDEEAFKKLLAEAVAPITERLGKLEAAANGDKPKPRPDRQPQPDPKPMDPHPKPPDPEKPQPEPEPSPPPIEVKPAVDAATAEIQALFEAAVITRFEAFVAQGKLLPAAREHFVAACTTPAQLRAVAALYDTAPAVVATKAATIASPKTKPDKEYSAEAQAWASRAKIDLSKLNEVA